MADITKLGTRPNGGWIAVAYDFHTHYGYETMLQLFDCFITKYQARVERIAKAEFAGQAHTVVWQKLLFNKAKPLTEMKALQDECGEVAIGCTVKAFDNLQMYLTLTNQTSVVTIQVPKESFTEQVQEQVDSVVHFFQTTLESSCLSHI